MAKVLGFSVFCAGLVVLLMMMMIRQDIQRGNAIGMASRRQEERQEILSRAARLIAEIEYVKDVRTGLCFVCRWPEGDAPPVLTPLECDEVPLGVWVLVR